ncbi:MAG: alpha/beta hydrolase [Butyrivibrio sp.]|nr:alpha/beta hydrolase [Butyrivibrio sp.]
MIVQTIPMTERGSSEGARLDICVQTHSETVAVGLRPLVLLCPGGAYLYTSDREAEPVALAFAAKGAHVAILRYSTAPDAHYPTSLAELGRAVQYMRAHAKEWWIDPDRIVIQGCSAGGHLAASYACFWRDPARVLAAMNENNKEERLTDTEVLKPNGLILCYPVITSGPHAHRDSIRNLLGDRYDAMCTEMSLETQVSADVPPTFLWHTWTDGSVPVQNSLLFASALAEAGINTELHIYPEGGHGLSLANRLTLGQSGQECCPACEGWIDLATAWVGRL